MSRVRDLASILTASSVLGTDVEITTAVSDHSAASDPHTGYVLESLIDAKGDLIVGSADNTVARLATGNSGESIVADSSTSTGLRYQGNYAAGKNKIINGDFSVWQRGTSTNSATSVSTFLADRFVSRFDYSSGTASLSQQTFTPGAAPVAGYEGSYFLRMTMPSGASSYASLGQKIEDVRTFAGQTVTVSFWAKSSSAQSATLLLRQDFGTGGSALVDYHTTYSLTTAWQRFTWTTTLTSITGKTIGTGSNLLLQPFTYGIYTSSSTLDIWGVQVEAGSVATAFQTATGTIQGELAACQRYYQRRSDSGGGYSTLGLYGWNTSTTIALVSIDFPQQMRVTPTSIEYGNSPGIRKLGGTNYSISSMAIQSSNSGPFSLAIDVTHTAGTANDYVWLWAAGSSTAYIGWSAEL